MSTQIFKPTSCDGFCGFNKITTYCFDCPALMCNKCKISMHSGNENSNHETFRFKNSSWNWNNKRFIMSMFDDKNQAENVYMEVSRKTKPNEEEDGLWQCESCNFNCNQINSGKCELCNSPRNFEINDEDYVKKIEIFQNDILEHFVELDIINENNLKISSENIMHCYIQRHRGNEQTFKVWYKQYYPRGRSLDILNNIFEVNGYTIRINELDRQYESMVSKKNIKLLNNIPNGNIKKKLSQDTDLIDPIQINKNNKFPSDLLNKTVTEEEVWNIIVKEEYTERDIRALLIELVLGSESKIDLLKTYLQDEDLRNYLKSSHESETVTIDHLKQVISDGLTIEGAINFLRKECEICGGEYPVPEMISLLTCEHELCKSCILSWLKEVIKSNYPSQWNCPICESTKFNNIDKNMHYGQLRKILMDYKMPLDIFDQKLLESELLKSENFHWCANEKCEFGFEAEGAYKIQCPSCERFMCVTCNRSWVPEHEGVNCQDFELWMLKSNANLSNLLKDIGIECPKCGMRYALAAGGCLHFDCKACSTNFCGGCDQFFVDICDKPNCEMRGFHSHHPRNCLYFLRDWDAKKLENMLQGVDYPSLQGKTEKNCLLVLTTKEFKEHPCNKNVYSSTGMCESHYREYLVQFINRYQIDPAEFVEAHELNQMLTQMVLPKLDQNNGESEDQFKERLKKEVKATCLFYRPKGIQPLQN